MGRKISLVLVDSSKLSRQVLRKIFQKDAEIQLLAEASGTDQALKQISRLKPDIVIIDGSMPKDETVISTRKIMAFYPTPILILTNPKKEDKMKKAFEALACGASEIYNKPTSSNDHNSRFLKTIKLVAKVKVITHLAGKHEQRQKTGIQQLKQNVVLIASSTGGPNALRQIISNLNCEAEAGFIVAQHIAKGFMTGLVGWLAQDCKLQIREAKNGDKLKRGLVLFCPAGWHTKFASDGSIRLIDKPRDIIKPSADILFDSAAEVFGHRAVGIILTGMGSDGANGLLKIKQNGGATIAQNEKTSVVFGMPQKAINLQAADKILPIEDIADYVNRLLLKR